ncbi:MAG: PilZ domain-containing protein [Pseudomonadota bacterium]
MAESEEDPRRKSKRFKVNWLSRVLLPDKKIVRVRTRDVSVGGVGFEYEQQLTKATEVNIEMSPIVKGKQYTIRAKGVVIYNMILSGNSGFSHGLKFTLIPKQHFEQLSSILKQLGQV